MLVKEIENAKIIAIIRGVNKQQIIPLVKALYDGGIKFVEVPFPQGEDEEITCEIISMIAKCFKGMVHVGAGTVLTEEQVEFTKKSGGEFIVSPDVCDIVIKKTKELGLVSIPGAYSPTEIMTAVRNGADFVKLFPVSELQFSYIRAIHLPLSSVKLLAFSGVNLENIKELYNSGVCGFGIGSSIIDKDLLKAENYDGIKLLAKKYLEEVI